MQCCCVLGDSPRKLCSAGFQEAGQEAISTGRSFVTQSRPPDLPSAKVCFQARSGSANMTRVLIVVTISLCVCVWSLLVHLTIWGGGVTGPSQKFTRMIFRPFKATFFFGHSSVTHTHTLTNGQPNQKFSNFSTMASNDFGEVL